MSINLICTACGKSHAEVRKMISLPNSIFVCDECVCLCVEIIRDEGDDFALITVKELAELRESAQIGKLARIWINGVRSAVAKADAEIPAPHAEKEKS